MIIGIGMDAVDIRRIERMTARFEGRMIARFLTDQERERLARLPHTPRLRHGFWAKTLAAKEATVKALGTGFQGGITWRDIDTGRLASGQPVVALHGAAQTHAQHLVGAAQVFLHLTLSDEYPYAYAYVVCEKR